MTNRLTSVSVRGLPGLPEVEVGLQAVTAIIGPRGAGKSRLLAAISWLLSGKPDLASAASKRGKSRQRPTVTARLQTQTGEQALTRTADLEPSVDLPPVAYLTAHARLPQTPEDAPFGHSDAARAEAMVASIAQKRIAGLEGEILLIEEPEMMLTPHQQRHLYGLLRRYAERNQVIYSTRAPALLDAVHYNEIVRLDLTDSGVSIRRASAELLNDAERLRLAAEFDHERNEMFFATAVVLVEGQTERLSLPQLFLRLGHDPDALGISIVEVGGKGNLTLAARVLAELRIPHVIVHDTDRGRPAQRENAIIRQSAGRAPIFELDPDFEGAAGIHADEDKVLMAWRRFARIAPNRIPRVFREIVETTVELASGSRGG